MKTHILAVLILLAVADVSFAQNAEATMQKALARAQFMLKKVNAENMQLQQQQGELQKQVESLSSQLEEEQASSASLSAEKTKLESEVERLEAALGEWKDSHKELSEKLANTRKELRSAKQDINGLEGNLGDQTSNFELCYNNNKKLYDINNELLNLYRDKSAMDALRQKEKLFQFKKVEIENIMQDYQYKLQDLNVELMSHQIKEVKFEKKDAGEAEISSEENVTE